VKIVNLKQALAVTDEPARRAASRP